MYPAIPRITEKIARIQTMAQSGRIADWQGASSPGSEAVFGAGRHRWQLSPPLSHQEVGDWEADMGVVLPEEYRSFLTDVGHTGIGPYYGLEGLYASLTNAQRGEEQRRWMRRYYQAACVYRSDIAGDDTDWLAAAAGEDWETRYDADMFDPQQGTLTLCQQGCGYETVLVLNGECRGRVVNAYHTDPPVFAPQAGFLAWYEGWLDTLLTGKAPFWYGYPARAASGEAP